MTSPIVTRRAGSGDLDALLANVAAGLATYAAFAPPGWRPASTFTDRDREAEILADPATWALLALVDDVPVGHVAFTPARERAAGEAHVAWQARSLVPGLAHLRQLFVLPDSWGHGVAPVLHDAAICEMRTRGYESARLFTPAAQARARRFYERRGWRAVDEASNEESGLTLTEYRRALSPLG
jgi:GNAT superfamily N-acetyltransferase